MAEHNQFGREAEKLAVDYIKNKSYQILATNWRYQKAEVDIFALYQSKLIVIEVKARTLHTSFTVQKPEDSIGKKKKKSLLLATNRFLEQKNIDYPVRFDVISIYKKENRFFIKHIENSFQAYEI